MRLWATNACYAEAQHDRDRKPGAAGEGVGVKIRTLSSIRFCLLGLHIWRNVRWDGKRAYRYCEECELVEWY